MKKKGTKKKSDLFGHKFMIGFGVIVVLVLAGIFYQAFMPKSARRVINSLVQEVKLPCISFRYQTA